MARTAERSARRLLVAALAVAGLGGALTACGGSGTSAATSPPVSTSVTSSAASVTSSTASVAPSTPAAATTTTSVAPSSSAFDAAKAQWEQGAMADAADQGSFWDKAAAALTAADEASYASAITDLKQLESLPDSMETASQQAESQSDVAALDDFFGTPGLYED